MQITQDFLDINSIPIPESGCILWLGRYSPQGYGVVSIKGAPKGVHRIVWELSYGPIPYKAHVCHKCDVTACINIKHLFIGTASKNAKDAVEKGKLPRGTQHCCAKLSEKDVIAIRLDKRSQEKIAKAYGVKQMAISKIKRRITWKHI